MIGELYILLGIIVYLYLLIFDNINNNDDDFFIKLMINIIIMVNTLWFWPYFLTKSIYKNYIK